MRVLHVCETIKGGIATYLATFEELLGDRIESRYLVPEDHVDQLPPGLNTIHFARERRGLRALAALGRAAREARAAFAPDILFFHSTFSLAAMAALRLPPRSSPGAFVYCPHGWARLRYPDRPRKAALVSMVEGRLAGLSDLVLNISRNDAALARAHGYRGRHVVVENALADLRATPGPSPFVDVPGRINLLFVGRFERQKGLDILLEALPAAVARNPALHLHVVGASVEGGSAIKAAAAHVTFHDWVVPERIADYYAHAALVVMPSRWEGLPMVLIEALRAATPVMVADTSGLGELIEPGASGYAVPPSPDAFAQALASLHPEPLSALRPGARARFETRFGAERFRQETLEQLEGLQCVRAGAGG